MSEAKTKPMLLLLLAIVLPGQRLTIVAGGSCREAQLCCNGRDSSCVVQKAPINAIIEDLSDKPCYCDHACLKLGDCCDDFKDHCGEILKELKIDLDRARLATQAQQIALEACQQTMRSKKEYERLLQLRESRQRLLGAQRIQRYINDAVRSSEELLARATATLLEEEKQKEQQKVQSAKVSKSLEQPKEIAARAEGTEKGRVLLQELRFLSYRLEESETVVSKKVNDEVANKTAREAEVQFLKAASKESLKEAASKMSLKEAASKKSLQEAASKKSLQEAAIENFNDREIIIEDELNKSTWYYNELRLIKSIEKLREDIEMAEAREKRALEKHLLRWERDLEEHAQMIREEREKIEMEEMLAHELEEEFEVKKSGSFLLKARKALIKRKRLESISMAEAALAFRDQCLQKVERLEAAMKAYNQRMKAGQVSSASSSSSGQSFFSGPVLSMVGQYQPSANDYLVALASDHRGRSPLTSYQGSGEEAEEEEDPHREEAEEEEEDPHREEPLKASQSSPDVDEEEPTCLNLLQANNQIISNLLETSNILNGHLKAHLGSDYDNEKMREVRREAKLLQEGTDDISLHSRQLGVKLLALLGDQLHKYYDLVDTQFGLF